MRFQNHHFMFLFLGFFLLMGICSPIFTFAVQGVPGEEPDEGCNLFFETLSTASQFTARQEQLFNIYQSDLTTAELRLVEVDFSLLTSADSINFNLFPGEVELMRTDRIETRAEDDYSWFGSFSLTQSHAILVVKGNNIVGTIHSGENMYRVRPLGNGLHAIIRVDNSAFLPEGQPLTDKMRTRAPRQTHITPDQQLEFSRDGVFSTGSPTIDVLVAYTPTAKSHAGDIDAMIQLAIDETNQSYENSDISAHLNLAHKYETSYTDSGDACTDLGRFASTTDGYMDEVHDRRKMSGADVCVLIVKNNSNPPGCGYVYPNENYAFAVVAQNYATGYYSFGHEIGHIQGAHHDPANATDPPFSYGHGYYYDALLVRWRTIMSYDCPVPGCPRIQYWSNPDKTYGGLFGPVPMGTEATHNNARVLNETSPSVAGFRAVGKYGSTTIFDHAPGNTYNPAKAKLYIPKGLNIYTARLTGEGHNHDKEGIPRVMRVKVNGNTYKVIDWIDYGDTESFSYTLPSGLLVNGINNIEAYIHWSDDYYDNGHWVSVNLELDPKTVNVSGYGTTTIFSNERGNTRQKAYAKVYIPSWMVVANGKVTLTGWGKNMDVEEIPRTMRVQINGTTKTVESWISYGNTDSFSVVLNPALFHTGTNNVYAYIHWGDDLYDGGHRLELKVTISQ